MDNKTEAKLKEAAAVQAIGLAGGAAIGAMTRQACAPPRGQLGYRAGTAIQVGSAMGAAARSGAGVGGTLAAGGAVVAAKGAAIATATVAAAPVVLGVAAIGVVGWGLYKLFKR